MFAVFALSFFGLQYLIYISSFCVWWDSLFASVNVCPSIIIYFGWISRCLYVTSLQPKPKVSADLVMSSVNNDESEFGEIVGRPPLLHGNVAYALKGWQRVLFEWGKYQCSGFKSLWAGEDSLSSHQSKECQSLLQRGSLQQAYSRLFVLMSTRDIRFERDE